jgi:hypothetical protein
MGSSHIAEPGFPFHSRVRETHAVFSGRNFNDSLAAITLINGRVTATPIKLTSSFVHKDALKPLPYACTNHDNHILSLKILD